MERNKSIDIFRGLTMALMIFVNDLARNESVASWIPHAAMGEDHMGLADFVYPLFLFAMGMSVPYAIESRFSKGHNTESTIMHIIKRALSLIIMGCFIGNGKALAPGFPLYSPGIYWTLMTFGFFLLWNAYPNSRKRLFTGLRCTGAAILIFLAVTFRDCEGGLFAPRLNILGMIGWTYLTVSLIYLLVRNNLKNLFSVWTAVFIICILTMPRRSEIGGTPVLSGENFISYLYSDFHLNSYSLMALGGAILACAAIRIKSRGKVFRALSGFISSAALLGCAIFLRRFWIAAKIGMTLPCVFYVYAVSVCAYTIFRILEDAGRTRVYDILLKSAGTCTITVYVIPFFIYGLYGLSGIDPRGAETPLAYIWAAAFSLIVIKIAGLMSKLHIKLKL